jgi:hypothetical protein
MQKESKHKNNTQMSRYDDVIATHTINRLSSDKSVSNIVYYILKKYSGNDMLLIGSMALWVLQQNHSTTDSCFRYIDYSIIDSDENVTEYHRDMDMIISNRLYNKLVYELKILGSVNIRVLTSSKYTNLLSRNIEKIIRLRFTISSDSLLYYFLPNGIDVSLSMDLIIFNDKKVNNIHNIYSNWVISHLSRSYVVWLDNTEVRWKRINKNNVHVDLTRQNTLLNVIESFKKKIYESNIITKGGDMLMLTSKNKKKLIFQRSNELGMILSGKNVSFMKGYKIRCKLSKFILSDDKISDNIKTRILEDDCCICSESLNSKTMELYISNCDHVYHVSCILKYVLKYLEYKFNCNLHKSPGESNVSHNDLCLYCKEPLIMISDMNHIIGMNRVMYSRDLIYSNRNFISKIHLIC